MGQSNRPGHRIQNIHQLGHPPFYQAIVLKWDAAVGLAEIFVKLDPFPDVKAVLYRKTCLVDLL